MIASSALSSLIGNNLKTSSIFFIMSTGSLAQGLRQSADEYHKKLDGVAAKYARRNFNDIMAHIDGKTNICNPNIAGDLRDWACCGNYSYIYELHVPDNRNDGFMTLCQTKVRQLLDDKFKEDEYQGFHAFFAGTSHQIQVVW